MPPVILAYHLVDSRFDFGITWVTPRRFERQMCWLAENGYRTCSLTDCLQRPEQTQQREVVLTFDDGYRALIKHALPVLQRCNFTATVFPVVNYIGEKNHWDYNLFWRRHEHLCWSELQEMRAAGWEIGSHSMRHAYLPGLSAPELFKDLLDSKQILEDHLQIPIVHLSLPFGRGNQKVLRTARDVGFQSVSALGQEAVTKSGAKKNDVKPRRDPFVFHRRGIYLHDGLRSFRRRVEAPRESRRERLRQRVISFFSMGTIIVKTLGEIRK
ncbi:MAG: polysaccharide deacetylase family protein [bacterium]